MATLTRAETALFLMERDRYAIVTHRRPDGDTLGSAAVLCLGLRKLGKTAYILQNPEITEKYAHLHRGLTKTQASLEDTLISVDVASSNMLPECFAPLADRILLRIDHHGTATSFTPWELVEPGAAACGEVIYDVLSQMGVQLDVPMANALYTAVSTDTGCFRYANTTANTFRVAAACAAVSPDLFQINQVLFDTNSLGRLRLQGWIIENALFLAMGQIAICALPLDLERQLGLTEDDMENISGFPRSIEGVKVAATLRENPDGCVKLSVRAVPGYDAAAICARFGGGGHKGAAGATLDMPLKDAISAVREAMPDMGVAL